MARRMFSADITNTDVFLDMPQGAQLLYFHLGMNADDDGFIASPKMVMRVIRSGDDDLKLLFAKKFLLPFDSGICVVKHWRINNQIRKDRYRETKYTKEKLSLFIRDNGTYTFNPENALPVPKGHFTVLDVDSGNQMATDGQPRLDKVSIVKVNEELPLHKTKKYLLNIPNEDLKEFTSRFNATEKQIKSKAEDLDNWCDANGKRKKDYRKFLLVALKKDFPERTEEEKKRTITRPKLNPDGSPVVGPNGIIMEVVYK